MPTEDAYSSGHLVLSHFGTCMCSNVETNLSWTCLVSGLLNFEHPSVLLFCLWPLTNSDFPTDQTFHQFHGLYTEFDLHRIMSGFHGAFATGVASQQETLTLPDTWFRPPFWDLLMLQLLRPNSSNLSCLYSTFHLEYPLVLSRFCFKYNIQCHWKRRRRRRLCFGLRCDVINDNVIKQCQQSTVQTFSSR